MQGKPRFPTLPTIPILRASSGEDEARRIDALIYKRMNQLAAHYSIDPNQPDGWYQLALKLARTEAKIPALQVVDQQAKRQGRPIEWNAFQMYMLIEGVEAAVHGDGCSVEEAAQTLADSSENVFSKYSGVWLKRKYYRAKRVFARYPRLFAIYKARAVGPNGTTLLDVRVK